MLAPVIRQTHRQLLYAAATRAIRSEPRVARNRSDGADVDDAPIAARDHPARHGLSDKKTAAQIGLQNQIPVFPRHVERRFAHIAAGVVHQNIQMAESSFRRSNHFLDARMSADVQLRAKSPAADRLYLRFE